MIRVCFKGEADGIQVEVAFQYVNEFYENVLGFCNNIYNAEGGTHLTGFRDDLYDSHEHVRPSDRRAEGKGSEFYRR
ncbi:MAG: hypothetical protein ACLTSZ_17300 [Lachnospiraceae bacterium]